MMCVSVCVLILFYSNDIMFEFYSLKRLQMDYIDLYQIHWPDRFVCRSYPSFISLGLGLSSCQFETNYDVNRERDK